MNEKLLLNFGKQPRCFDFVKSGKLLDLYYDFSVCQTINTGLIKLKYPIPAEQLHPTYDWIRNKEPNDHANIIAQEIIQNTKKDSRVLFLSNFDKIPYILTKKVIGTRALMLDTLDDLNIIEKTPDQALIQDKIKKEVTVRLLEKYGQFEIITSCRLLEHTASISNFVEALNNMLKPGGKIIVEVPDSTKSLLQGDIAMLWEEHIHYFTPESLRSEFEIQGYVLEKQINYHYPQEDALICIFSKNTANTANSLASPHGEYSLANVYKNKINSLRKEIEDELIMLKKNFGEIVIFGGGHRTIMFINLLNIASQISYIIDDDKNKKNLRLPGSNLKIKGSASIKNSEIGVCLLSVNIRIEEKIINLVKEKACRRIEFFSISPDSQNALHIFRKE